MNLQPIVWGLRSEFSKFIHKVMLLDVLVHIGVKGETSSFSCVPQALTRPVIGGLLDVDLAPTQEEVVNRTVGCAPVFASVELFRL